jgi:hypothetical protein
MSSATTLEDYVKERLIELPKMLDDKETEEGQKPGRPSKCTRIKSYQDLKEFSVPATFKTASQPRSTRFMEILHTGGR